MIAVNKWCHMANIDRDHDGMATRTPTPVTLAE